MRSQRWEESDRGGAGNCVASLSRKLLSPPPCSGEYDNCCLLETRKKEKIN